MVHFLSSGSVNSGLSLLEAHAPVWTGRTPCNAIFDAPACQLVGVCLDSQQYIAGSGTKYGKKLKKFLQYLS
jgi:hypothetical protein